MEIKDRQAKFIIWFSRFKVIENKDFNIKCDKDSESRAIYVFNNEEELLNYFLKKDCCEETDKWNDYLKGCLEKCIFMIIKKGTILAYKAICDKIIEDYNIHFLHFEENINESIKVKELSK